MEALVVERIVKIKIKMPRFQGGEKSESLCKHCPALFTDGSSDDQPEEKIMRIVMRMRIRKMTRVRTTNLLKLMLCATLTRARKAFTSS